jgi:hypothetical protein
VISDKILENYDKYVLGELPANFEPEGLDEDILDTDEATSGKKMTREDDPSVQYQSLDDNDDELMRKL